jgi:hypothetical protein
MLFPVLGDALEDKGDADGLFVVDHARLQRGCVGSSHALWSEIVWAICLELSSGGVIAGRPSLDSRLRACRCDHILRWCLVPGHDDRGTTAWRAPYCGVHELGNRGEFQDGMWGARMSNGGASATKRSDCGQRNLPSRYKIYLILPSSRIRSRGCPLIRACRVLWHGTKYSSAIRPEPMDHAALGLDFVPFSYCVHSDVLKHQWRGGIPVACKGCITGQCRVNSQLQHLEKFNP